MPDQTDDSDDSDQSGNLKKTLVLDSPAIPNIFANNSFIDVNPTDISIAFMHDFGTDNERVSRPSVRITFSHPGFVEFVRFANTRLKMLEEAYGGEVPSLRTVNNDLLRTALDRMYGRLETEEADKK